LQDIIGVPAWDSPWWRNMSADTRMTLKHYVQVAYKEKRLVRYEVEIEAPGDNKLIYIDFSISPVFGTLFSNCILLFYAVDFLRFA
jgi:hypothetical protein